MSTETPANWYPDPQRPGYQRYWDGIAWTDNRIPDPTPPGVAGTAVRPQSAIGRWAIVLSVIGLGCWPVLIFMTTFRDTIPVMDTWVSPAVGAVLLDAAALVNVLCIWRWRERSTLNILAAALTTPIALFITLFVVGEGLGGA